YQAWQRDEHASRVSLMMALTTDEASELSGRARRDLVRTGIVEASGVLLANGNRAGVGDRIITRHNDRRLTMGRRDWVKNGDQWRVEARLDDGALRVRHLHADRTITLPADYVAQHVELAYATTVTRAQGMTVDTGHALMTPGMSRQQAYPALT